MSIVPSYARFQSGGKPVAISSVRRIVRVTPEGGTSGYEPNTNPVIRFELSPSLGFLDTHQSFLSFRVRSKTGTVDHTQECRLDANSMSWVRRMTIYSSTGSILEDLEHYNLLVNLLHKATSPDDYKHSIGQMIDNSGNRAVRNGAMAHPAGSMYNSGFDVSGILGGKTKLLPCGFFQGPMTIELTLAPMKDCFVFSEASGQTASYQIDNVEYHAHCLSFSEEYNAKFSQQLRERGVDMSFDTYKTHNSVLTSDVQDLSISQNAASVKGVYHVLRDKGKYQSNEHDSLSTYKSGNLAEIQWDMGGKLTPEMPIKLTNDGITNMYTHNLHSFNMFRNLSLGCSVDDSNFASTEASLVPHGNHGSSYKALPVRRVYGTWVANGGGVYNVASYDITATKADGTDIDSADGSVVDKALVAVAINKAGKHGRLAWTVASGKKNPLTGLAVDQNNTVEFTHTVSTLTFVPDNVEDVALIQMGMRCKIGVGATAIPQGEDTLANPADITGSTEYANLVSTTYGLDRFYSAPFDTTSITGAYSQVGANLTDGKSIMYSGAPCSVAWAHTGHTGGANAMAQRQIVGLGVPFVDGQRRPILSKQAGAGFRGWCDMIPSDESFFIGCSFETHQEDPGLVSGSDLTNATPLHVRLNYSGETNFYQKRETSDPFTSFVHIDSVLRLQSDGTLISSV